MYDAMRMKKFTIKVLTLFLIAACICVLAGCGQSTATESSTNQSVSSAQTAQGQAAIPIKVLILPHFEDGEMSGDFPGEAQYYFEEYLQGGDAYEVRGLLKGTKLYVKDGIALCTTGEGKVSAALTTSALMLDERFDFSEAYVLAVGCAGAARDYGVLGDVYVITAAADFEVGHHADPREQSDDRAVTWYHDTDYDHISHCMLNQELANSVFELVKDTPLETTEKSIDALKESFPGEEWASRPPQVLKGTSITSDNYWKGTYNHQNAQLMAQTYQCPDPYAATEMEDVAICRALKNFGMLDRLIILRVAVNMDVFLAGTSPESLWGSGVNDDLSSDSSDESIDIFVPAMRNNYVVGKTVIQAILDSTLHA